MYMDTYHGRRPLVGMYLPLLSPRAPLYRSTQWTPRPTGRQPRALTWPIDMQLPSRPSVSMGQIDFHLRLLASWNPVAGDHPATVPRLPGSQKENRRVSRPALFIQSRRPGPVLITAALRYTHVAWTCLPVRCRALASVSCGNSFVALLCDPEAPVPARAVHTHGQSAYAANPPAEQSLQPGSMGLEGEERKGGYLVSVRLNFFLWHCPVPPDPERLRVSGLTGS